MRLGLHTGLKCSIQSNIAYSQKSRCSAVMSQGRLVVPALRHSASAAPGSELASAVAVAGQAGLVLPSTGQPLLQPPQVLRGSAAHGCLPPHNLLLRCKVCSRRRQQGGSSGREGDEAPAGLLTWLQGRLMASPQAQASIPEALKVFRQLQDEVRLTAEGAAAWKDTVADARR